MRLFIFLPVLAAMVGMGYFYQQQQHKLEAQLQQLDYALVLENKRQVNEANGTLKYIEAEVAKNYNAPAAKQMLRHADALHACVQALLDTLQANRAQLLCATANPAAPAILLHPGATGPMAQLLGQGTSHYLALRRQLATCADTLRQFSAISTSALQLPSFSNLSVLDALTSITQLESDVLTAQASALRRLSRAVGPQQLFACPVAIGTAESNIVAPGDTYHAQLLLVESLTGLPMKMFCDGRPVSVGPDGMGLVRFKAPTRPGPATWTGTICFKQYGHNTTFQVTVPYRVARR